MVVSCKRCCLHKSMRIVNVFANFLGMLTIIYALWLLKKWTDGFAQLNLVSTILHPWFIYTCLGIGIVVCLSALLGHMVANHISNITLAIYIFCIFSLLLIQAGFIFTNFFKNDWKSRIIACIDDYHDKFKSFLLFHLIVCRLIAILVIVPQTSAGLLATVLWSVGGEDEIHSCISYPPDFTCSFLADNNSPPLLPDDLAEPRETMLNFSWREFQ